MYQFFVNIAHVKCEVHWSGVGLALKCTLSVLESALESFEIEKDAIGPFTALRSFLENNQLPLRKLNTFQNRAIYPPTKHYEEPIEDNGSNWPPVPWIGGLLTELKFVTTVTTSSHRIFSCWCNVFRAQRKNLCTSWVIYTISAYFHSLVVWI